MIKGVSPFLFNPVDSIYFLKKSGISDRQIKAIQFIKENGFITNTIMQQLNNVDKSATTLDLQELVDKNLIFQEGKAGRGVKYRLNKLIGHLLAGEWPVECNYQRLIFVLKP